MKAGIEGVRARLADFAVGHLKPVALLRWDDVRVELHAAEQPLRQVDPANHPWTTALEGRGLRRARQHVLAGRVRDQLPDPLGRLRPGLGHLPAKLLPVRPFPGEVERAIAQRGLGSEELPSGSCSPPYNLRRT